MKKQPRQYALLTALIFCLGSILWPLMAQQNQKALFPNPDGFPFSTGFFVRPTSDGGYITLGTAVLQDDFTYSVPRVLKVNSALQTEWDHSDYLDLGAAPNGIYLELYSAPLELTDGSFVFGMSDTTSGFDILSLEPDGALRWGKDLPGWENRVVPLAPLPGGSFLATRSQLTALAGWQNTVVQVDANGNIVEEHPIAVASLYIYTSILLSGGDIVIVQLATGSTILTRIDTNGNVIWQTTSATSLVPRPAPNDGFGAVHKTGSNYSVRFFDAQGVQTGQTPTLMLPIQFIHSLDFYPDGSFLIAGRTLSNTGFLARYQPDGAQVWSAESPEDGQDHLQALNGYPTSDGWGIGTGGTGPNDSQLGLLRVSENSGIFVNVLSGNVFYDIDESCLPESSEPGIAYANIKAMSSTQEFNAFSDAQGNYLMIVGAGDYEITVEPIDFQYILCPTTETTASFPANANGNIVRDFPLQSLHPFHHIKGKLWLDQNDNCIADAGESILRNWRVDLKDAIGVIESGFTNINGEYDFSVPSGNYEVEAIAYNQNFSICAPVSQAVSVTTALPQTVTLDFTAHPETDCAQMRISLDAPPMRVCVNRTLNVYYRNDGAAPAENATLDVTIPAGLHYVSANPAPASVAGNTLHFELGQVLPSPGDIWTSVDITVFVQCDTLQIGDVVCVEASVSPNEICGWNGAVLSIEGECEGDNAVFTVKNIGNAASSAGLQLIIIEDQIVLLPELVPSLIPDQERVFTVMPMLDTVSIVASMQQETGFPGDNPIIFTLTNCSGLGGTSTGFGGDAGPFSLTKCIPVVNSYDPNDKNAFPLGYGEEHIVKPGTPLDYTIRFQNTGNDTAYLVVIRDTLSQHFNPARLEILGATHPYEFALLNDSILHFTFNNILLPDSTTNRAASEGAIHFRVYPKTGLEAGTVVDNRAAIYFDYNKPIITNTVRRKYQELTLVKTDDNIQPQALNINIYPNPFSIQTTFELPEGAPAGDYALELYDAAGRQLRSMAFDGQRCQVMRNALPAGMLFWKISREGRMVASGKMIAE